ncbi:MAG: hypothetical protein OXH63_11820 [Gemmatimonadetes bacterium]|nr:hypothetical protein [Gemmatimonadota bacterium]
MHRTQISLKQDRILVDTGAWYALVDHRDPDHGPVLKAVRDHRLGLLTSNSILDETATLIRFRSVGTWRIDSERHCAPGRLLPSSGFRRATGI